MTQPPSGTSNQERTVAIWVRAGDGWTVVWHTPEERDRLWAGVDRKATELLLTPYR